MLLSIQNQTVDLFHEHDHSDHHEHHQDFGNGDVCDAELHQNCLLCHYLPLKFAIPDQIVSKAQIQYFLDQESFLTEVECTSSYSQYKGRGPPVS